MKDIAIIAVCALLGFGIIWTMLGSRERDKQD
jgi:hypothetical protein